MLPSVLIDRVGRTLLLLAVALMVPVILAPPANAVEADGRYDFPYFLQLDLANTGPRTQVVIDAAHGDDPAFRLRWASQAGVSAGRFLLRVDRSGFVRSLDGMLALAAGGGLARTGVLTVRVREPGVSGEDVFTVTGLGAVSARPTITATYAAGRSAQNALRSVSPYTPQLVLPLDVTFVVGAVCRPDTYLQVSTEYTGYGWLTPTGIQPGVYRARILPDHTVVSLDGKTTFNARLLEPWDQGHPVLGAGIVRACDQVNNDGVDVIGFGRQADGTFVHMTTWSQEPDGGYGWQPFNCGAPPPIGPPCAGAQPRPYGFGGGNQIFIARAQPEPSPCRAWRPIHPDTATANRVARLYAAYLQRTPDTLGWDGWVKSLVTGALTDEQISEAFARSTEFTTTYGNLSNRDFVRRVYLNVLGREPDPAGWNGWVQALDAGRTRGWVMAQFAESTEFRTGRAANPPCG